MTVRPLIRVALRMYPFYTGGGALAHAKLPRRLTRDRELVETTLRGGTRILAYVDDPLGRTVYYTGDYDPRVSWVLRRVLRPGDCLVDIGANMGALALLGAALVGPRGVVHAFEPQPALGESMRRSAALNGFTHMHVHEVALSERDGTLELHVDEGMTATASLEDGQVQGDRTISVRVRRTEAMLRELGLPAIRVLKIDVERHEEAVLRGTGNFLRENTPEVVLFESLDEPTPFRQRGAVRLIEELGYDLFQIPKPLVRMRLLPVGASGPVNPRYYDYVGVRTDEAGADARRRLGVEVA